MIKNLLLMFNALFIPGILVWFAAGYLLWRRDMGKHIWKKLIICFFLMAFWRICLFLGSSRYFLNLLFPTCLVLLEAGYFFYDREVFLTPKIRRNFILLVSLILVGICIGKTLHYNPYKGYYQDAFLIIQQDIMVSGEKNVYLFTKRDKLAEKDLQLIHHLTVINYSNVATQQKAGLLKEYRNLPFAAYFLIDEKKDDRILENIIGKELKKRLKCIAKIRKNRKNHRLAIYKFAGNPNIVRLEPESLTETDSMIRDNLLAHGDFKESNPLKLSGYLRECLLKHNITSIREGALFPVGWSIDGTPAYWMKNSNPVMEIIKDTSKNINMFHMQNESLISLRSTQMFDSNSLILDFYAVGSKKSIFSVAFHEFDGQKYIYERYCSFIMPNSNQTLHITIPLKKDDFKMPKFMLCFELQQGNISLFNIVLRRKDCLIP